MNAYKTTDTNRFDEVLTSQPGTAYRTARRTKLVRDVLVSLICCAALTVLAAMVMRDFFPDGPWWASVLSLFAVSVGTVFCYASFEELETRGTAVAKLTHRINAASEIARLINEDPDPVSSYHLDRLAAARPMLYEATAAEMELARLTERGPRPRLARRVNEAIETVETAMEAHGMPIEDPWEG